MLFIYNVSLCLIKCLTETYYFIAVKLVTVWNTEGYSKVLRLNLIVSITMLLRNNKIYNERFSSFNVEIVLSSRFDISIWCWEPGACSEQMSIHFIWNCTGEKKYCFHELFLQTHYSSKLSVYVSVKSILIKTKYNTK